LKGFPDVEYSAKSDFVKSIVGEYLLKSMLNLDNIARGIPSVSKGLKLLEKLA
jgi:hypothetical protein